MTAPLRTRHLTPGWDLGIDLSTGLLIGSTGMGTRTGRGPAGFGKIRPATKLLEDRHAFFAARHLTRNLLPVRLTVS